MADSLYARIAALEAVSAKAAVVTVVRTTGSTPRAPGARMLVLADGSIEGTIGGGRIEAEAIKLALTAIGDGRPVYLEHQLTQELGMCCGGSVSLFVEPLERRPILIIYGAGHVGTALTRMAAHSGFAVHVADEREELLTTERLAEARKLHDDLDDPALPFGPETYVMVTTHDHALDQRLVEKALALPHRWLGLIGSRRKAELTKERLEHKGFDAEKIGSVRSPVGLAIGAETPEEIAISILAELIADRRKAAVSFEPGGARLEDKRRR